MKILIVEDDPISVLVLRKTLTGFGHDVTEAEDGAAAWELLQTNAFEVVITDWVMPKMDGIELCRRIRNIESGTYTYVIILTAKSQRDDRIDALRYGADDMLIKPLDPTELRARLGVAERFLHLQNDLKQKVKDVDQLREVLEVANRRVRDLFQGLPIPCFTIDTETRIMECNSASEALFNLPAHRLCQFPVADVIVGHEHAEEVWTLAQEALSGQTIEGREWNYPQHSGEIRNLLVSTFPMRDKRNVIVGAGISFVDITERKRLEAQLEDQLGVAQVLNEQLEEANTRLERLARTDGLTGLDNYRSFREQLAVLASDARQNRTDLSVVLLDVDKFKNFNDSFGHPAGDEVLRQIASILRSSVRRTGDIVARYGGEEFVIVLPGANKEIAERVAETARANIEQSTWELRAITASMGIATLGTECPTDDDLILKSDEALYHSKEAGRNRVTHFGDMPRKDAA